MTDPTVRVLGIPTEGKENFLKGVSLAPAYIRWAFQSIEDYSWHQQREVPSFEDLGDLPFIIEETDGRNRYDRIRGLWPEEDLRPPYLLLGGDHLVTLVGVEKAHRHDPDLVVVHLDAHGDARTAYLGDVYTHATVMRHVSHEVKGRVVSIGIRSRALEEHVDWEILSVPQALDRLEKLRAPVYLSVDVDAFKDFPCVSNYEPGGLTFEDFLLILDKIQHLIAADLVEFNPLAGSPACASYAAVLFREMLIRLAKNKR